MNIYLLHQIDIHCIDVAIEQFFGFESCFFIIASFDFVRVNFIVEILNIHLVKLHRTRIKARAIIGTLPNFRGKAKRMSNKTEMITVI